MQNYYQRPPMRPPYQNRQTAERCPKKTCIDESQSHFPIAMAYVPWQSFFTPYPLCKALSRGTIFEDLDKPFIGKGGRCL